MFDVTIVGGGMAGMTAAICAAKHGYKVLIIEKNKKLGTKIYATGNGHCNLSNKEYSYDKFNSDDEHYSNLLDSVFGDDMYKSCAEFLKNIGIQVSVNDRGYAYPVSNQASAVMWTFTDMLKELGVNIYLSAEVCKVEHDDSFKVTLTDGRLIESKTVILAGGGLSYSKLGGSDKCYKLAADLGHGITDLKPSLCGLSTNDDIKSATGVRIKADISSYFRKKGEVSYKKLCDTEYGELQITDYGLSGIVIFNISSKVIGALGQNDVKLSINFMQDDELPESKALYIKENFAYRSIYGVLNTYVNEKLALVILNKLKVNPKNLIAELDVGTIKAAFELLSNYEVSIEGFMDFENAQVTKGGINLKEIKSDTLESKLIPDLYIVGEMLDVDGICGGYNLSFAVCSAIKAVKSIYDKNKSNKN